ncbi:hypothetical protein K501DRAFT_275380 [Backusella circina FSU 941]|nr:hypothetical protein K501DRAFT_275380 [Backusella circina FSU 941]
MHILYSSNCKDTVFKKDGWHFLNGLYKKKYKTAEENPDANVALHWDIVIKNVLESRDVTKELNLLKNYDGMLVEGNDSNENNFIRVVWSVMFEELFIPKTIIRVATDIRLVYNESTPGSPSIDLYAGEVAKEEIKKTVSDESKVFRKAKNNLDVLLLIIPSNLLEYCICLSSLLELHAPDFFLYLDANGLYIKVPKYDFNLPKTILELFKFPLILKHLLILRREIYFPADLVQTDISKCLSIAQHLGRQKHITFHPKAWSLYSLSICLVPPAGSILDKLMIILTLVIPPQCTEENDHYDEFGWVKQQDGWPNVKIMTYSSITSHDSDEEQC